MTLRFISLFPPILAFTIGFALMAIEIVAGRFIAPYLGVSIYTWTSVIGVILTGITLGNIAGGILADKKSSQLNLLLPLVLICSGVTTLLSCVLLPPLGSYFDSTVVFLPVAMLILVATGFLLPAFFFGMTTPILIRLSLHTIEQTGHIAGKIYGSNSAGAILGTFATGFFFIPSFGIKQILITIGLALIGIALLYIFLQKKRIPGTFLVLAIIGGAFLPFAGSPICVLESQYYCINLYGGADGAVRVQMDHLVHSFVFPDKPENLGDAYQQVFALIVQGMSETYGPPNILFLGGGGYVLPRYLSLFYPDIQQEVVEIDPGVTRIMEGLLGAFDFPIIHEDARVYVNRLLPDKTYDIVLGDAFQDYEVPYQLTTKEFVAKIKAHLNAQGVYVVNVVDSCENPRFLASMVKTIAGVFTYVHVISNQQAWENRDCRTTHIVIASDQTKIQRAGWESLQELLPPQDRESAWMVPDEKVIALMSRGIELTDNFVPTESLVANVFVRDFSKPRVTQH